MHNRIESFLNLTQGDFPVKKRVLYALLAAAAIFLAACGQKLSGVYTSNYVELEFQSGGKVLVGMMGVKTELKYEVDGKNLKIFEGEGKKPPLVLAINDDGSIQWIGGIVLRKKEK